MDLFSFATDWWGNLLGDYKRNVADPLLIAGAPLVGQGAANAAYTNLGFKRPYPSQGLGFLPPANPGDAFVKGLNTGLDELHLPKLPDLSQLTTIALVAAGAFVLVETNRR